jgi:hypothetical protein
MAIDPGAWDADVEGIIEIALKIGETIFERFGGRYINPFLGQ